MKILIVTPHFHPEGFKCNDMAFELQRRGHEVSVMTAIPDYPQGYFPKGYGVFRRRRETVNGVKIHRSLIIPRGDGSAKRLAINYLSYSFFATLKAFWFGLTRRYDQIIVHETSPVMVGVPAVIIKKMQRIPMHFWVLDLWPESLAAAGGISNKKILGAFSRLTKWIYRNSDTILISSRGFRNSICKMGDFGMKIKFFPNWVDETLKSECHEPIPAFPDGFNVVFTGNIGDAQDMPHILDAAQLLAADGINFVLIGDGRKRPWVEEQVSERGLKNVFCPGRFPLEMMPKFFERADILFLSLKDSPIFSLTVPAKLQAYMSSGKPIVAMINGEGADVIAEADCGWSVPAEDSVALAETLRRLFRLAPSELAEKGANGLAYSQKYYNFNHCMNTLLSHLSQITPPHNKASNC